MPIALSQARVVKLIYNLRGEVLNAQYKLETTESSKQDIEKKIELLEKERLSILQDYEDDETKNPEDILCESNEFRAIRGMLEDFINNANDFDPENEPKALISAYEQLIDKIIEVAAQSEEYKLDQDILNKIKLPQTTIEGKSTTQQNVEKVLEEEAKEISQVFGESVLNGLGKFIQTIQSENEQNKNAPYMKNFIKLCTDIESIYKQTLPPEVEKKAIAASLTAFCKKQGIYESVRDNIAGIAAGKDPNRNIVLDCLVAVRVGCQKHYEQVQEQEKALQLEAQIKEEYSVLNWKNKIAGVFDEIENSELDSKEAELILKEQRLKELFMDFYKVCMQTNENLKEVGFIEDMSLESLDVQGEMEPEGDFEPWEPSEDWLANDAWESFRDSINVDVDEEDVENTLQTIQLRLLQMNAKRKNAEQMTLWDSLVRDNENSNNLSKLGYALLTVATAGALYSQKTALFKFGNKAMDACSSSIDRATTSIKPHAKNAFDKILAGVATGLTVAVTNWAMPSIKNTTTSMKDAIRKWWASEEKQTTLKDQVEEEKKTRTGSRAN